jgi:NAD(P)-dependent dehydrogenase (short-subunit alcohol dehydrogenase family)
MIRRGLAGRKLVITGAARAMGERVARPAVTRGARVALIGLEPDRLRALADELGPAASWWEANVRSGTRFAVGGLTLLGKAWAASTSSSPMLGWRPMLGDALVGLDA